MTATEFAKRMAALAPFEPAPLLAVAVSGGPDSMALAALAADWAAAAGGRAVAILIDHGLRPESAREARVAAEALARRGVETRTRAVAATAPSAGVAGWARRARYRLLLETAREMGALHLLLAHHRDDQAETLLLNLARGSGAKGLAAMRPTRGLGAMRLLRPMLDLPKARLAATAAAAGLPVADDPSNRDPKYARARVRAALAGMDDDRRLAETAARLGHDDDALEAATAALAARALAVSPLGVIEIDRRAIAAAPEAVALRILARAAHAASGRETPPRQARALAALQWLRAGGEGGRTLGGAIVRATAARVRLWREAGSRPPPPVPLTAALAEAWDGRFRLRVAGPADLSGPIHVAALGRAGLAAVDAMAPPWRKAAPRTALAALPALWSGTELLAVPRFAAATPAEDADCGAFHGLGPGPAARLALVARFEPRRPIAPLISC